MVSDEQSMDLLLPKAAYRVGKANTLSTGSAQMDDKSQKLTQLHFHSPDNGICCQAVASMFINISGGLV